MQKILIVDDEIDLCDLIAELAEEAGLDVRAVSNSAEVEQAIADFAPQALMLDLMMPGTDGVELLRLLSDRLKGVKIALMSGSDSRVLNSARRLGSAHGLDIIATLEKPLEIALIRQTIAVLTSADAQVTAPVTAANLSQAITEKQMQIVVQPIVDLNEALAGLEVLPRWLQTDGSELTADQFIEKVRTDGLLGQLTQGLIEKAMTGAKASGTATTLAFNIMPEQLHDPYFTSRLLEQAAQHGIAPTQIALELSELPLQQVLADVLPAIKDLRDRGLQIWLNDYAGKMSLANLMQLPLSGLKLSRHLVLGLPNEAAENMIAGAIALAQMRQLPVYAVAVETPAQRDTLVRLGVTGHQGKLTAAPMSFEAFNGWQTARG